jgi:hypothetical protein
LPEDLRCDLDVIDPDSLGSWHRCTVGTAIGYGGYRRRSLGRLSLYEAPSGLGRRG